jgi:hypothetical protein
MGKGKGGNAHDRAMAKAAHVPIKTPVHLAEDKPTETAMRDESSSRKTRHRPDAGTVIGFVGAVLAIILFLEERTPLSVALLLLALFFILLPLMSWSLLLVNRFTEKRVWQISPIMCAALVSVYGYHAWPDTSYDPGRLRQISIKELKHREHELSDEMRVLQSKYDRSFADLMIANDKIIVVTKREETMKKLGLEFRTEFYKHYMGRASAIREELMWRLGKTPEQVQKDMEKAQSSFGSPWGNMQPMLPRAFLGILAGASPVSDAATYLDLLADQLH